MLKTSHASDLCSTASYYSVNPGILKVIEKRRLPLPPARMIRLTPACSAIQGSTGGLEGKETKWV